MSTGVPSSPRNVISIVNETSVILEWHAPRETGGRDDVVYNIVCKKCRADRRSCSHCDDNVDFIPRQLGLTDTRVFISNLWAHTLYSFEIQAVNGVSNKSPYPAQHVSIDITTNQAGKWLLWQDVMIIIMIWLCHIMMTTNIIIIYISVQPSLTSFIREMTNTAVIAWVWNISTLRGSFCTICIPESLQGH